jgi:predicted acylesterase/phospholipase RssA
MSLPFTLSIGGLEKWELKDFSSIDDSSKQVEGVENLMKRRPRTESDRSFTPSVPLMREQGKLAVVFSGGGARAAYQVGALKALSPLITASAHPLSIIIGSSIGAINGLVLAACLKDGAPHAIESLENLWRERTFRSTFAGSPSRAFLNSLIIAKVQYSNPGPYSGKIAIFDPRPLQDRLDEVIDAHGGLRPEHREPNLTAVGVMTTVEGATRRPLLFLSSHKRIDDEAKIGMPYDVCYIDDIQARHGFASAALPSVLPPVEIDTEEGRVRLVDGGISHNVPVDPAVRLGAEKVIVVDISGRDWWCDRYGDPHDKRPTWEVPSPPDTYCLRPPETVIARCVRPLGPLLKESVGSSTKKFISALGPVWPLFTVLKNRLGEEVAYEAMSYVALDYDYLNALMERGYYETLLLRKAIAHTRLDEEEKKYSQGESFLGGSGGDRFVCL